MAGTYACPRCERLACYGGDPYPCSWCGFDGRIKPKEGATPWSCVEIFDDHECTDADDREARLLLRGTHLNCGLQPVGGDS